MMPGDYNDYRYVLRLMALEGLYGYCPERNLWMFYRECLGSEYEISVEMSEGEVVDARFRLTTWMSNIVENHHVVVLSDAPDKAVEAAFERSPGELSKPYNSEFS
jgi:hypothetical protein